MRESKDSTEAQTSPENEKLIQADSNEYLVDDGIEIDEIEAEITREQVVCELEARFSLLGMTLYGISFFKENAKNIEDTLKDKAALNSLPIGCCHTTYINTLKEWLRLLKCLLLYGQEHITVTNEQVCTAINTRFENYQMNFVSKCT